MLKKRINQSRSYVTERTYHCSWKSCIARATCRSLTNLLKGQLIICRVRFPCNLLANKKTDGDYNLERPQQTRCTSDMYLSLNKLVHRFHCGFKHPVLWQTVQDVSTLCHMTPLTNITFQQTLTFSPCMKGSQPWVERRQPLYSLPSPHRQCFNSIMSGK